MKTIKLVSISAFILLFAANLGAQTAGVFFLSADSLKKHERLFFPSNWKYHAGDSAVWANPAFDDSAWETFDARLDSDKLPKSGWHGIGWFRLHLEVDSTFWGKPLALNLYQYGGAAEIYLDGKRLCTFGTVGASLEDEQGGGTTIGDIYPPKFILFDKSAAHVVAVRRSSFLRFEEPLLSLGFAIAVLDLNRTIEQSFRTTRYEASFQMLMTAAPLVLALLHLLLFAFYPRLKENLYFALFAMSISALAFLLYQLISFSFVMESRQTWFVAKLINPVLLLMFLFGLRFLYVLFYEKLPRQFWVFLLISIGLGILPWSNLVTTDVYIALGAMVMLVEMLRLAVLAFVRKKEDAWIIGLGFVFFILTVIIMMLSFVGVVPLKYATTGVEIFWILGVLGLLLSMSIYLARQIARTSKNLEAEITKTMQLEVENARKEVELQKAAELKAAYQELDAAHTNLKATQQQLITQEKLASLGQLTAGIAHEIKNPLNFVNNFAALSIDLAKELDETLASSQDKKVGEIIDEVKDTLTALQQNAEKINHHGKRADSIVKSMMQHARGSSGQRELVDINHLLDEAVNLTYHGMRANDAAFNITIEKEYDASIGKLEVVPQDISRVFLNIINNACYAAHQKKKDSLDGFSPMLSVSTKNFGDRIEIRLRDNGNGIPADVREKIFNPFFTTKPSGQGTGLGLSISYDIIVQQHRGEIKVESEEGKFTEFVVRLPRHSTWRKA